MPGAGRKVERALSMVLAVSLALADSSVRMNHTLPDKVPLLLQETKGVRPTTDGGHFSLSIIDSLRKTLPKLVGI